MLQTASLPSRIKEFYERVSVERRAALDELPHLYDERVHFINPVADEKGLVAFRGAWDTALRKYKVFKFHDIEVIGTDEQFSLTYSMTISFGFGPDFRTDMATLCRASGGKVVFLRDYFDPLGSLVQPFGPINWLYRKVFGVLVA
ncbi:MAG: nuclear transport factor 2 family protein [Cyanobacteria bacterium]|nr:nuclear transport factor 2 family protein [Cyanobacteriota bacterium]